MMGEGLDWLRLIRKAAEEMRLERESIGPVSDAEAYAQMDEHARASRDMETERRTSSLTTLSERA